MTTNPEQNIYPPVRVGSEVSNVFTYIRVKFGEEVEWHYERDANGNKFVSGYAIKAKRK